MTVRSFDARVRPALVLPERLDGTTVGEVREALQVAIDAAHGTDLVLDVGQVRVVDSIGLALLLSTHRTCARQGRRLVLADPQPRLLRILAVTRLHRVLHLDRAAQPA
jgi:anti-anti-sigma factor